MLFSQNFTLTYIYRKWCTRKTSGCGTESVNQRFSDVFRQYEVEIKNSKVYLQYRSIQKKVIHLHVYLHHLNSKTFDFELTKDLGVFYIMRFSVFLQMRPHVNVFKKRFVKLHVKKVTADELFECV